MSKITFTSFNESINYLFNLERRGIKYDLKNIKSLLKLLNNPEKNFKSIHVAGTNGKGSVSSILNSYLIEKGFKTGLYTSPHISDFRERILVNGKFISKKYISDFVNKHHAQIDRIRPSFFEATTAMAFDYFSMEKVQYAVVEAGLGGRLDSTNVLDPVLSIITGISIDHTDFLGKTIEKITKEKGGIIKNKRAVIAGRMLTESKRILISIAQKKNTEIIFPDSKYLKILNRSPDGISMQFTLTSAKPEKLLFPVTGDYQLNNVATSIAAAIALERHDNVKFTMAEFKRAIVNMKLNSNFHGRFEMISSKPDIVIDISHNLQAIENVKDNLKYFKFRKLFIIFGMMKDKNYKECVNELAKLDAQLILTKPDYERAAEPDVLYDSILIKKSSHIVKQDLSEAFAFALNKSSRNDLILVTGSFFIAGDLLKLIKKGKYRI